MPYSYYAEITIDHTKVSGAGDLTDFPVLVSGTYDGTGSEPDIRTVANGGNVQNVDTTGGNSGVLTVPADLAFYNDVNRTTQYDHEIESYDATTGAIVAHVRVPTLDGDAATSIFMFYGDAAVTTSQEDINGTWDANYKGVFHFNNSPASGGDAFDSTSSPANMTSQGSMVAGDMIDDIVGKAWQFEEASSQYARSATSIAKFNLYNSDMTVEIWFDGQDFTTHQVQLVVRGDAAAYLQYHLSVDTTTANKIRWQGTGAGNLIGATGLSINTEYYVAATRATSTGQIYLNGVADGSSGTFTQNATRTDRLTTGYNVYDPTPTYSDLIVGEIRVSSVARSADWLLTTYNSLKNPSTFYTMGNETSVLIIGPFPTHF